MPLVVKWRFYDPIDDVTLRMEVNPNSGAAPAIRKNIAHKTTTAPTDEGATLLFEGAEEPQTFDFGGVILTQTQYEAMVLWVNKKRVIRITDDLLRDWDVYLTGFAPRRKISRHYPWRHDYDVTAVIVRTVT